MPKNDMVVLQIQFHEFRNLSHIFLTTELGVISQKI